MSLDQKALFDAVACAHRNGVLQKTMVLLGEAIEEALEEGNLTTYELLHMLDDVEDATLAAADGVLGMVGGFIPLAASDNLMALLAYLLNDPNITSGMKQKVKEAILNHPVAESLEG